MKKCSILKVMMATILFLSGTANAVIWYVHPDSTFNCIQDCLDSCATGDTVLVGPGLYVENIVWPNTQGIDLISDFGPDTTIIDGNASGVVIICTTGVDTTTVIRKFTIRNGFGNLGGGGIYCEGSSPTIEGNIIADNFAFDEGGGIYCGEFSSAPIIINNIITANYVYGDMAQGGGICCWDEVIIVGNTITDNEAFSSRGTGGGISCGASIIKNNVITDNTTNWSGGGITSVSSTITDNIITGNASPYGGGIICVPGASIIRNNVITGNTTVAGGGIFSWSCSSTITGNTISTNTASYGGGIYCFQYASPVIDSCSITNNTNDGIYCEVFTNPIINYCNIYSNSGYGVLKEGPGVTVDAGSNWWGDATGPYHPTANPGGLGDTVSDYVDFDPWLIDSVQWVGVEEEPITKPIEKHENLRTAIFSGPLLLPRGKKCRIFDITGRVVEPPKIPRGIYFIEVDGVVTQKVVKIR